MFLTVLVSLSEGAGLALRGIESNNKLATAVGSSQPERSAVLVSSQIDAAI